MALNDRIRKNAQGQPIGLDGQPLPNGATPLKYADYGLWFGSIEDVDLNFNGNASAIINDSVTIEGTKFISDLTVDLGGGDNTISVAGVTTDNTTINTQAGIDDFTIHSLTGGLTINSGDGHDAFTVNSVAGTADINATGGNHQFDVVSITGDLDIDSRGGSDVINLGDITGDLTIESHGGAVDLSIDSLSGAMDFDMTGGTASVRVHSITGDATIDTDNFADNFVIDSITGSSTWNAKGGNDVFIIHHIGGDPTTTSTTINAGDGDDTFCMNHVSDPDAQNACIVSPSNQDQTVGIAGTLNVHGQRGNDAYFIGLTGQFSSTINVLDQSPIDDTSNDFMKIFGTNETDYLLFRPRDVAGKAAGTVAAIEVDDERNPVVGGRVERLNYDSDINAGFTVHGRDGDDWFILDDNEATLTIYGDRGNDTFQVGQLFKSPRDADAGLAPEDQFPTTLTTQGYLSNGISFPATLYGGDGEDNFNVNRNLAELSMFGENDNDTFIVRSFVAVDPDDPKKPFTNINGGQGADFIAFTVNAPVNISGGDGLDTLTIIGTEFGDDFVVTDQGVSGAGRYIAYAGVEKVVVDAMQGNDTFFIESTNENVDLEIVGGLGSDTFNVAGTNGKSVTVVSNDLKGHSGLITHTVDSTDPTYQGIKARGLAANIGDNDEAGVMITPLLPPYPALGIPDVSQQGTLRVFENTLADTGFVSYRYAIVLTRAPEEDVRITASPTLPNEDETNLGGKGITLNGSEQGFTALFSRDNWDEPQYVEVRASLDSLAEGQRFVEIRHSVIQGASSKDSDPYDRLAVSSLKVEVVDHEGNVLVRKISDTQYSVQLAEQPTADVTITPSIDTRFTLDKSTLTFNTTNWQDAQTVTLSSGTPDATILASPRVRHAIASLDDRYNEVPVKPLVVSTDGKLTLIDHRGLVLIQQSDQDTQVAEAGTGDDPSVSLANTDHYEVVLSDKPESGKTVTVSLRHDGQVTAEANSIASTIDPADASLMRLDLVFNETNWNATADRFDYSGRRRDCRRHTLLTHHPQRDRRRIHDLRQRQFRPWTSRSSITRLVFSFVSPVDPRTFWKRQIVLKSVAVR